MTYDAAINATTHNYCINTKFTLRFQAWYETQLSYININLNNFTIRCFLVTQDILHHLLEPLDDYGKLNQYVTP